MRDTGCLSQPLLTRVHQHGSVLGRRLGRWSAASGPSMSCWTSCQTPQAQPLPGRGKFRNGKNSKSAGATSYLSSENGVMGNYVLPERKQPALGLSPSHRLHGNDSPQAPILTYGFFPACCALRRTRHPASWSRHRYRSLKMEGCNLHRQAEFPLKIARTPAPGLPLFEKTQYGQP